MKEAEMFIKSETKKLTLKRESLRELTDTQMSQVAGGTLSLGQFAA